MTDKEFSLSLPKKDDFPDFGDSGRFDQKKMTKREKQKAALKKAQEAKQAELDALPHKGKKSEFFIVKRDVDGNPLPLEQEQKLFVFIHYPTYTDPDDMVTILDWLEGVAADYEWAEAEAKKAYGKPKKQKSKNSDEDVIYERDDDQQEQVASKRITKTRPKKDDFPSFGDSEGFNQKKKTKREIWEENLKKSQETIRAELDSMKKAQEAIEVELGVLKKTQVTKEAELEALKKAYEAKEAELVALPHQGKKAKFFKMNRDAEEAHLGQEQNYELRKDDFPDFEESKVVRKNNDEKTSFVAKKK